MIEILTIDEIKKGDIILIEGIKDGTVHIVTVEDVDSDGAIIPANFGGLDVYPEDPAQIVKIGYMSKAHPGTTVCIDSYWVNVAVREKPEIG